MGSILIGILEDDLDQSALLQVWLEDAGFNTRVSAPWHGAADWLNRNAAA